MRQSYPTSKLIEPAFKFATAVLLRRILPTNRIQRGALDPNKSERNSPDGSLSFVPGPWRPTLSADRSLSTLFFRLLPPASFGVSRVNELGRRHRAQSNFLPSGVDALRTC